MSDGNRAAMSALAHSMLGAPIEPDTPWEAKSILSLRQETLDAYRPASQWAAAHYDVSYHDIMVAGVSCMEVTPASGVTGNRQILYIFGGGFMLGSPFEDLPITAALAAKTGARVIVPYYRLAPEHPYPAALDDVFQVAQAMLADAPHTVLSGESAGGNLALALVHRLRRLRMTTPPAIAVLSPATNFDRDGHSQAMDHDPFLRAARLAEVHAAYVGDSDPLHPEISPLYGVFDRDFPPLLMTTGTRDLLMSDCIRLARVMRESGAAVDLRVWDGMWHVFEFYPELPEAQASLNEIANFIQPYLE